MKKSIFIGICIFIFGYIFVVIVAGLLSEQDAIHSYDYAIICAIIFLSGIVGSSTSLILKRIDSILEIKKEILGEYEHSNNKDDSNDC